MIKAIIIIVVGRNIDNVNEKYKKKNILGIHNTIKTELTSVT